MPRNLEVQPEENFKGRQEQETLFGRLRRGFEPGVFKQSIANEENQSNMQQPEAFYPFVFTTNSEGRNLLTELERQILRPFQWYRRRFLHNQVHRLHDTLADASSILDIGSGTGVLGDQLQQEFPNAHVVSTDIENRHLGRTEFVLSSGNSLPFPDKSFDISTFFYVLHHIADPRIALREATRVTKGKIIVQEDTYSNWMEKIAYAIHVNSYRLGSPLSSISGVRTDSDWERIFREVGLEITHKRRVHKLGYPVTRYEYQLTIPAQSEGI